MNHSFWKLWLKTEHGRACIGRFLLAGIMLLGGSCSRSASSTTAASEPIPDVYVKGSALVSGTDIDVVNKDTFDWQNVELDLNAGITPGPYRCHVDSIKGYSDLMVPASKFTNSSGESFDITRTKPQKFTVHCTTPEGKGSCEGEWD